jgi:predicted RNase H-like nuclease
MLRATDWEDACRVRYAADGKRCSRQTFSIINKIREVDDLMSPAHQTQVMEGHPEVSFAALSGQPLLWSKRRSAGRLERLTLLRPVFPEVDGWLARFSRFSSDVIDALACLWTARRVRQGDALHFSPVQTLEDKDLRMEIVA